MGIREFPNGSARGKAATLGMRRSPDVSPRRLSDISPQLRQLKYLVVDEAIKEDLKWSRSVEDLTSASVGLTSIEERILRITGYYGYQPWAASYKHSKEEPKQTTKSQEPFPCGAAAGRKQTSRGPVAQPAPGSPGRAAGRRSGVRSRITVRAPLLLCPGRLPGARHAAPTAAPRPGGSAAPLAAASGRHPTHPPPASSTRGGGPGSPWGRAGGGRAGDVGFAAAPSGSGRARAPAPAAARCCGRGRRAGSRTGGGLRRRQDVGAGRRGAAAGDGLAMKKHSARVAPLSACNSPVLTLTKVEGDERSRESPAPAEAQMQAGAEGGGRVNRCCWKCSVTQVKKIFWGVAVVLGVCSSWSGSTQLAKLTFKKFDAPFTLTWFATNWNFLFFPLYYLGHVFKSAEKQSPKQRYRECCRFFGDNGLTLKVFFTKAAPFGVLWTLTNYLYLHAIKKINTTDVSVLFCCNKAFVFLLSWIVLRDRFMGVRIVAAIFAIAGIVMMTYADGFHSHSVIGIALVVGSASMSALYKVLFKLLLGSAKFGEAALFLSVLAVFNVLFITCIPVILYFTKVEYWSSFDIVPWGNLCGFSILLLTFNILLNFGIAITYPTLISLGIVLSVPVNAVVDHYTSEIVFNSVRVIAIIIIGLGFLLLLLPEEWDVWVIKLLTRLKVRKKEEIPEGNGDIASGLPNKSRRTRPSMSSFAH